MIELVIFRTLRTLLNFHHQILSRTQRLRPRFAGTTRTSDEKGMY